MMGPTTILSLLAVAMVTVDGRVYSKCDLASELVSQHGISRNDAPDWVCMAFAESSLNTSATNTNSGGSSDYGIFQINSYWNCDPQDGRKTKNGCGHPCSDYRNSNIGDDVDCVKQLLREHRGWGFSYGHGAQCSSVTSSYLRGCTY
ncbi:lysozyme c-1-like [Haliotis cracherodii]|uniref:lysozyme c-1-like n=1 Tax=Haliotis cracherodii TaxID=6455 RepID=UPI0039E98763